jgi:hypothetical protein
MGPAESPLRELSEMVIVRSGPGISAPERAMTNDVKKRVIKLVIIPVVYLSSY